MARANRLSLVNVTAGGTYSIPVFSSNELVYVYGSATLASNLILNFTAPPMGLVAGTNFKFIYDGSSIIFGSYTCTVEGILMPNVLRTKKLIIDCYYNGVAWSIRFLADYADIVASLPTNPVIFTDTNDATSSTPNPTGGYETLRSHEFDNPIEKASDGILITVTGNINTANTVDLLFTLDNGTLATNISGAGMLNIATNGDFIFTCEVYCTDYSSGNYKRYTKFEQTGVLPYIDTTANVAANLCNASVSKFTLQLFANEDVDAGGEVSIYGVKVERRTAV